MFLQLLTVLAEKPPASAGYRGSDLVLWRFSSVHGIAQLDSFWVLSRHHRNGQNSLGILHLKTDLDGYPIGFHLTGGEASDSRNFEVLLDLGPDVDPRAVVADK
ncbi:MAG TPA: hypothetical protein VK793_07020, partial [Steroidobacteraceae bacterium]|nr:hypothetical protein [Steroidobacteraceae bacterium]